MCDEYEMYRFANKLNTNVQGGFSKLLKYFIKTYKPKTIHTYANMDHSNGNVYTRCNFEKNSITKPGYI